MEDRDERGLIVPTLDSEEELEESENDEGFSPEATNSFIQTGLALFLDFLDLVAGLPLGKAGSATLQEDENAGEDEDSEEGLLESEDEARDEDEEDAVPQPEEKCSCIIGFVREDDIQRLS